MDGATSYVYDGEAKRVKKLVGENTRFIYGIGGQLIAEYDGSSGNLKKEYVAGGGSMITIEPTAINSDGAQYATADHLGSPRVITNSSGSVVSRHDYLPFGEELGASVGGRTTGMGFSNSGDNNRKKFTGYEADTETGLNFAQARYNASVQGRFSSPDPLAGYRMNPQSLNRYSYVLNNPERFVDPFGLQGKNPNDKQQPPKKKNKSAKSDGDTYSVNIIDEDTTPTGVVAEVNVPFNPSAAQPIQTTSTALATTIASGSESYPSVGPASGVPQTEPVPPTGGGGLGAGIILSGTAAAGLGSIGGGGTGNVLVGNFCCDPTTGFATAGAAASGGANAGIVNGQDSGAALSVPDLQSGDQAMTFGGSAGLGAGIFLTNAKSAEELRGPFWTRQLNLPLFSIDYSASDDVGIVSITFGPSVGGSYWSGRTTAGAKTLGPSVPTLLVPNVPR